MVEKSKNNIQPSGGLAGWIDYRLPVFSLFKKELNDYPTPRNLNYWWNFGSLAGATLVIMIITGIALAMHYTADPSLAFNSVESIMRDVNYGWLIRYIHLTGSSFFFIVTYIHIFRGLYYGSYKNPRELLWIIGVVILLLMMATAFFGYVLPWSQMGFWGATVITNLFSAIPVVGDSIVTWLWGGFSVGGPTLGRFYALHFLLPFVIVGVVILHLVALHQNGSNNPTGIDIKDPGDTIPFHPYYTVKDLLGFVVFIAIFAYFAFYIPNYLNATDGYIPADPMKTPSEVVPQWYFLPFFAILRSIPNKLTGVIAMFAAVGVLFLVPWLDTSKIRSATFRPIYRVIFWLLVVDVVLLGWVGANRPEGAVVLIGRLATSYYFVHFLILMPMVGLFERPLPVPSRISEQVLRQGAVQIQSKVGGQ